MKRNIKLIMEYDGTDFCGWQLQPEKRTAQGEIEKSLAKIFQKDIRIIGSGRTDSGVHALGQAANFILDSNLSLYKMKSALNGTLPKDIRIISIEEVPEKFHSRFDAKRREYHYKIAKFERAIDRDFCWYCKYKLDIKRIQQASQYIIGKHDFQSFCHSNSEVKHHLCNIEKLEWLETETTIKLIIIANRFLHNMVRIIIGTMIDVGRGKLEPEDIKSILDTKNRDKAGTTVPAKGLCLMGVYY